MSAGQARCPKRARSAGFFGTADQLQLISSRDMPPEARGPITGDRPDQAIYAARPVGQGWRYASDDPTGETPAIAGASLFTSDPDKVTTRRTFDMPAWKRALRMPLTPQPRSPLVGMLSDRWGIRWMITQDAPQP
ncbi:VOC family protein [Pseudooceanicola sp. C21-150M6]|uniref:VOC family protein n=1 Tax=Pseudooceanicola sp. C21-150M6 TaxID=3434355 RepID=UPI003D7F3F1D